MMAWEAASKTAALVRAEVKLLRSLAIRLRLGAHQRLGALRKGESRFVRQRPEDAKRRTDVVFKDGRVQ
jgi:hypothetical protein